MQADTYHLLGRLPLKIELPDFSNTREGGRVLITGGNGFVGQKVAELIEQCGGKPIVTDINDCDILYKVCLDAAFKQHKPKMVIHLAAHKYATDAEETPASVANLNITGTQNVVEACRARNAKLVLASTCKAADPCTAYGASKLIAERIVLNYERGRVFRLVNVIGSSGSVIEIWNNTPAEEQIKVTKGRRYFISPEEAAAYLLAAGELPKQKVYAPNSKLIQPMDMITLACYWNALHNRSENFEFIPLRRGDREVERIVGEYESEAATTEDTIMEVVQPWS